MTKPNVEQKIFEFSAGQQRSCMVLIGLGILALSLGFMTSPARTWANFLLNAIYFVTLAVFGVFFVALHHLTGARWSEVIRKIPEAMSQFIPLGGLLMLVSLLGLHHLYEWSHVSTEVIAAHGDKHRYLNIPFFSVRMLGITGLWWGFARRFNRLSYHQDRATLCRAYSGVKTSASFMIVFALSFAIASYDWIMSLEPHWFSTVFSVYHFSGLFVAGIAVITIVAIVLKNIKVLKEVNENHLHDLGKYLFAFSMFWAYIWFCQFMLIWYGNIPEETVYYVNRLKDDWSWLFYFNFFLNFCVPFAVLLPRAAKRSAAILLRVSIVLLVGHWLDLYLMIMPPVTGAASNIGFLEVAVTLGFAGAFIFTVGKALAKSPILPAPSDLLSASLHHHQ